MTNGDAQNVLKSRCFLDFYISCGFIPAPTMASTSPHNNDSNINTDDNGGINIGNMQFDLDFE